MNEPKVRLSFYAQLRKTNPHCEFINHLRSVKRGTRVGFLYSRFIALAAALLTAPFTTLIIHLFLGPHLVEHCLHMLAHHFIEQGLQRSKIPVLPGQY